MEHMFDWLYKQANLQSMCSITTSAMPPEYQRSSARAGGEGVGLLLTIAVNGWGLAGSEPRGGRSQGHLRPPPAPLWGASASGYPQALAGREKNKTVTRQVQASGVKPDVALKMKLPSAAEA